MIHHSATPCEHACMHALVGSLCEAWPNVIAYILNEVFEYESTTLSYMSTIYTA